MNWAILVAAGKGLRLGLPYNKVFADLAGVPILRRSALAMLDNPLVDGLVVVTAPEDRAQAEALCADAGDGKPIRFAEGGALRQDSVAAGLAQVTEDATLVLVHDAARPLVSREIITEAVNAAQVCGCAAPAILLNDTIKTVDNAEQVLDTPERGMLRAVQTPQVFERDLLVRAHAWGAQHMPEATDDTLLVEKLGEPVQLTQGAPRNLKITTPEDLLLAEALLREEDMDMPVRVGTGYDVHRLVPERPLILLGETIPFELGLLGHSDADVAAHALSDALLGAAGLGDIGRHFPDTDARYEGADSMALLRQVVELLREVGYTPQNVDVTIVAQRPKLSPHIPAMRSRTAGVLGIAEEGVNVKATTTEGLGFEGEGLGISAQAAVAIQRCKP